MVEWALRTILGNRKRKRWNFGATATDRMKASPKGFLRSYLLSEFQDLSCSELWFLMWLFKNMIVLKLDHLVGVYIDVIWITLIRVFWIHIIPVFIDDALTSLKGKTVLCSILPSSSLCLHKRKYVSFS